MAITVSWKENMTFVGKDTSGHEVAMDASQIYGGTDQGVRPMDLLLMAVAGCSAIELTHILNKMRIKFDSLSIETQGNRADDHPKVFTNMQLVFKFTGPNIVPEKVLRALELTDGTYCSVSNTVGKVAKVSYVLDINGQRYDFPAQATN